MRELTVLIRNDMRKHEIGGRPIFVIDDLFDTTFVRMVYHFMHRLPFSLSDYDKPETEHVRHWKYEFDPVSLPSIPVVPELVSRVVSMCKEICPSRGLKLNRMHCNLHFYGDIHQPHTDLTPGLTALYFANPRWDTNWTGETIFYDDSVEPLYAVIPRPGRLIVYSADILHRGGVPSRECTEPRITVAFKFLVDA